MSKVSCIHFVGFKGDDFNRAKMVFGAPDFIHRQYDGRAKSMIMPEDTVVFAKGTSMDITSVYSFDDSAVM